MPELIVHCGLHKTGTTALQNFLWANRHALRRHGVLYPQAGVPDALGLTGQHNLAWLLARDRRYRADLGDFGTLFGEALEFDGRVLLSSEEFESSLLYPERWDNLLAPFRARGFRITLVVYVRSVVEHLESVYLQKLRSGFADDFASAARIVAETGTLRAKEWQACFDRQAIARQVAAIGGVELTLRDYERLEGNSSVPDFVAALGLQAVAWDDPSHGAVNPRDSLDASLGKFLVARDADLSANGAALGPFLAGLFEGQQLRLATPDRLRRVLEARLMPPGASRPVSRPDTRRPLNITRLFSFETHVALRQVFLMASQRSAIDADTLTGDRMAALGQWWRWVQAME